MTRTADLVNRFSYHAPDDQKRLEHERVREVLLSAAAELDDILVEGREKALFFTKLEESMFWANAAIARRL